MSQLGAQAGGPRLIQSFHSSPLLDVSDEAHPQWKSNLLCSLY